VTVTTTGGANPILPSATLHRVQAAHGIC
jgi:hypothetical protein